MSTTTTAIRKSVFVEAPPERAFRVFTAGIGGWWPLGTHSVTGERAETAALEGRPGGRLYERAAGGEEADWGRVLVWEPPARLVFTWHPGRGEETAQEVELRFAAEGEGTRVELEHRGWERLGDRAAETRGDYETGWDFVLGRYVARAG